MSNLNEFELYAQHKARERDQFAKAVGISGMKPLKRGIRQDATTMNHDSDELTIRLVLVALGVANIVGGLAMFRGPILIVVVFLGCANIVISLLPSGTDTIPKDTPELRSARKTVKRLLALEPGTFSTDWALPAPESYALISGVTKAKRDAPKLGLLQLIAMGVLARGPFQTLRRGPTSADTLAGSLAAVHRLWAASAEDNVQKITDGVVEGRAQEAKGSRFDCPECGRWLPGELPLSWHRKAEHGAGQWIKGGSDV